MSCHCRCDDRISLEVEDGLLVVCGSSERFSIVCGVKGQPCNFLRGSVNSVMCLSEPHRWRGAVGDHLDGMTRNSRLSSHDCYDLTLAHIHGCHHSTSRCHTTGPCVDEYPYRCMNVWHVYIRAEAHPHLLFVLLYQSASDDRIHGWRHHGKHVIRIEDSLTAG